MVERVFQHPVKAPNNAVIRGHMSTALRWLSVLSIGTLLLAARAQAAPTATPTATTAPTAIPTATTTATPTSEPATLEVRVTDAPPKGVTKILITVEDIEVNVAGDAADSGWRTIIKGDYTPCLTIPS